MKFHRIILACLFFIGGAGQLLQAQTKVLDGVLSLKLRNMGPLYEQNIIKGYYMFYQQDKLDRKTFSYQLRILDENLNPVSTETIEGSRYLFLLEGSYNQKSIMMKFWDSREKQLVMKRFGMDGKLVKSYSATTGKYEAISYQGNVDQDGGGTTLHAIPNEGFVNYRMVKDGKYGYIMEYYGEDGKNWTAKSSPSSKMMEVANFLGVQGDVLLSSVIKKKSIMARKFDTYIIGTNIKTGKRMFESKMENSKYDIQIMNVVDNTKGDNLEFVGLYFKLGDNVVKDPSLGFCRIQVDMTGKMVGEQYVSWQKDVAQFMPVNHKGKLQGIGYVFFHKVFVDDKGEVYMIGEQYKKTVSGAGIAVNALGGQASNFQLTIDDMMIFRLNSGFELQNVDVFVKSKSRAQLPAGAGLNGAQLLAAWLNAYGAFDYAFTQESADKDIFTVGFIDWDREGKGRNKLVFGAITRIDGEYSLDKINLTTDASRLFVQPGKPGYIVIIEYFRKEKKVEMRLEQINY